MWILLDLGHIDPSAWPLGTACWTSIIWNNVGSLWEHLDLDHISPI